MLRWALVFFVVALVAAVLGFTGIALAAAEIHSHCGADYCVGNRRRDLDVHRRRSCAGASVEV